MPSTRMTKDEREVMVKAVTRLAVARRAELTRDELSVFVDGVSDLPDWAVERACRVLGGQPRAEYEPAMPDLGTIRVKAEAILRYEREKRESQRLLSAPPVDPVPPEKQQEFLAKIRQLCGLKAM